MLTVTASCTYDDRNRLVSATVKRHTVSYAYDDDGNRVSSTTTAGTTSYEFDQHSPTGYSQVLAEKNKATGAIQAAYAHGAQLLAQARPATGTSIYVYDGHGSVRVLADTLGAVADTYAYDAFGNLPQGAGARSYTLAEWHSCELTFLADVLLDRADEQLSKTLKNSCDFSLAGILFQCYPNKLRTYSGVFNGVGQAELEYAGSRPRRCSADRPSGRRLHSLASRTSRRGIQRGGPCGAVAHR